jgi:uncharacterized protein
LWEAPIRECGLPHRLDAEHGPRVDFSVVRDRRGVLVRGRLTGKVVTPCDRCAEETEVVLDSPFELYEELPLEGEQALETALLRLRGKVLELDVGGMLWEQFVLACRSSPVLSRTAAGCDPLRQISMRFCTCADGRRPQAGRVARESGQRYHQ